MHEQHGFKCPPFCPIALTLPILLVLLGLFQGPLCEHWPEAWGQALESKVSGSSRRLSYPRLVVSAESWGRGGARQPGPACRPSLLPQDLGKPCRVPGFSADPRIARFCCFLDPILLEPQLREKQCCLSKTWPSYLRPIFVALLNRTQKLHLVIGPPLRSFQLSGEKNFVLIHKKTLRYLAVSRWGSAESFRPVQLLVNEHFCGLPKSTDKISPPPRFRGGFLKLQRWSRREGEAVIDW